MVKTGKKIMYIIFFFLQILTTFSQKKNEDENVLLVAAAADLVLAFKEIGELFEKETKNKVNFVFSSSGTAREQIENGAPYDVYASANIKFVDDLISKNKIIEDSKELYAIGRICLVIKKNSGYKLKSINDILKQEFKKISIADPSHAPYGLATKEALISLGLWENVKEKLVYAKDIQHSLSLIRTGNVEIGFISLSILDKNEFDYILIDDKLHNPLKQAIGVVKGTKKEKIAREFIKFVNGKTGRKIMKKYGFVLPDEL